MRERLIELINKRIDNRTWTVGGLADHLIENGVIEVRHGEWLLGKYKCMDRSVCSVCNAVYEGGDGWNYCPHCGAKMDGERKTENE